MMFRMALGAVAVIAVTVVATVPASSAPPGSQSCSGRERERLVFGEDTKELDHGTVISTEGSWEAGVNKANAGIFMPAHPAVGDFFKQEDAKNVAEDCTRIVDLNASVSTPFVNSNEALKTEEFSLLEPGVLDSKFYVKGIGNVKEQTVQGGDDVLNLVSVTP